VCVVRSAREVADRVVGAADPTSGAVDLSSQAAGSTAVAAESATGADSAAEAAEPAALAAESVAEAAQAVTEVQSRQQPRQQLFQSLISQQQRRCQHHFGKASPVRVEVHIILSQVVHTIRSSVRVPSVEGFN
jgi:hypothetical protein